MGVGKRKFLGILKCFLGLCLLGFSIVLLASQKYLPATFFLFLLGMVLCISGSRNLGVFDSSLFPTREEGGENKK